MEGQRGADRYGALAAVADQVRARADIVEVVSEFVALRPAGRSYKGLCPFHQERTPSFTVSPERQLFYCFGCGAGGNVFTFLMKIQGLRFPEAVLRVAERVGMAAEVERVLRGGAGPGGAAAHREALWEVQERAAAWFAERLWKDPGAEGARRYLARRGVTAQVARDFRLGYAPDEWHALERALGADPRQLERLREAGLVVQREDGRHYDRFRGRLIFPIADLQGRVVGFGGRALVEGQEPKYLNSPESPVYRKSQVLYGLDRALAAIRRSGRAVVVEGYMDVLAMHQYGLQEAVATCGTSLTPEHGRLLARFVRQVVVAYDADAAGQVGALRSLQQLRAAGLDVRVAVLPPGHDPDSLLRQEGRPAMEAVLEEARGVWEFAVEQALAGAQLDSPAGKAAAVANVLPILLEVPDAVEQEALVEQVAGRLGVPARAVRREMERARRVRRQVAAAGEGAGARVRAAGAYGGAAAAYNDVGVRVQAGGVPAAGSAAVGVERGLVIEQALLRLLVETPELAPRLRGRLTGADFSGPGHGALFDALVAGGEAALADPALAEVAGRVLASSELAVRPDAVEGYVKGVRAAACRRELMAIEAKIEAAARPGADAHQRLASLAAAAVSYREVWETLRADGMVP